MSNREFGVCKERKKRSKKILFRQNILVNILSKYYILINSHVKQQIY